MKYGLIGKPLGHSYSKEIHALIAPYEYELKELDEGNVCTFLKDRDFEGINVTIPYKQTVIPYLDKVDESALAIGAVNTIVNCGGKLCGYNTDFDGMCALFVKNGIIAEGKKALILGTGGTSNTAYAVLKSLGASEIIKVSRSGKGGAVTYEEAYKKHCDAQIIVNTTPSGMYPNIDESPINLSKIEGCEAVVDAIYNPLRTRLVLSAEERGIKACGGLYMLVAQAVYASAHFMSKKVEISKIDEIFDKISQEKRNIALIGMPSCGKSTIGKLLAEERGVIFVDTDTEIEKKTGLKIAEIFAKYGEKEFRKIEKEMIKEVSLLRGAVIATGGGAVLDEQNAMRLKSNAKVVFLDRKPQDLTPTEDRPLSRDCDAINALYEQRYPIYIRQADVVIKNDKDIKTAMQVIRREI